MPDSTFLVFFFISSTSAKRFAFISLFNHGNKKSCIKLNQVTKSDGARESCWFFLLKTGIQRALWAVHCHSGKSSWSSTTNQAFFAANCCTTFLEPPRRNLVNSLTWWNSECTNPPLTLKKQMITIILIFDEFS